MLSGEFRDHAEREVQLRNDLIKALLAIIGETYRPVDKVVVESARQAAARSVWDPE